MPPQTLTKAALSVYKGSALEADVGFGSMHEDSQLIGLLAAQMQRQPPKAESCQIIVNVAQLLARTPSNRHALLATVPHAVTTMQRHAEHEGLQETGLGLLGNLACGAVEEQMALLRAGCLPHAVLCLQRHVESAGVQRNAYRFLRNVTSSVSAHSRDDGEPCCDDVEGAAAAAEQALAHACVDALLAQRVPQLVAFMLHRHIDNATVLEHALAALWSFACAPPLARLLSECAAADGVLRAMGRHPASAAVQRCGCGALAHMLSACGTATSRCSPPAQRASPYPPYPETSVALSPTCFSRPTSSPPGGGGAAAALAWSAARPMPAPAELAPHVLAAAFAHPDDPLVQIEAMGVLASLARSGRAPPLQQAQLLDALRVASAALASPKRLAADANVIHSVCDLLEACLPKPDSAHAPLVHAESEAMLPALLAALGAHPEDDELAATAAALLSKLCAAAGALAPAITRAGGLPLSLRLARRFVNDADVAPHAVHVLRCLLSFAPREATGAFVRAHGVAAVLSTMGAHPTRIDVQEAGVSVLWSCLLDAEGAACPDLHPRSAALQAALTTLGGRAFVARHTRAAVGRLHRGICGLIWALTIRPPHARSICTPPWLALLASCATARLAEPRVREYICGIGANLLALAPPPATTVAAGGVLSPTAAVMRFPALTLATGGLLPGPTLRLRRLPRHAAVHAGAQRTASMLLRRAAASPALVRSLLLADAPHLLCTALSEPHHLIDDEGEDSADDDDDLLSRDAATAVHALLAPLATRLLLARAVDPPSDLVPLDAASASASASTSATATPAAVPAVVRALVRALTLARPWLSNEQLADADARCLLLPLPLTLATTHVDAQTAADWAGVVGGVSGIAVGAAPSVGAGCGDHFGRGDATELPRAFARSMRLTSPSPPSTADAAAACGSSPLDTNLVDELLLLVLAYAASDARSFLACAATCTRWRALVRTCTVSSLIDLSDHSDELSHGGPDAALPLASLMALPTTGVRALSLARLSGSMGARCLDSAMRAAEHLNGGARPLRVLDLSLGALLSPIDHLPRVAATWPLLQVLDISGCAAVDDEALAALGRHAAALRLLNLNACVCVTDRGLAAIAPADGASTLASVHLFGCPHVGPRGVAALAAGCPQLAVLDLTGSGAASDDGVLALAHSGRALRAVGAGGAPALTDASVMSLATACRTTLECVFLPACPRLTAASGEALRACPRVCCLLLQTDGFETPPPR